MNFLTTEEILELTTDLYPEYIIHPTSVAYIRSLLTPYAEAIENATAEEIMLWVPLAIPGKEGVDILKEFRERLDEMAMMDGVDEADIAKGAIMRSLIKKLLGPHVADGGPDYTILPWDIQFTIACYPDLCTMFGIKDDDHQLPVTVAIGPNKFAHMLTQEFTVGLLLFSDPTIGNRDFNITLFGEKFTSDYIVPLPLNETAEKEVPFIYRGDKDVSRFALIEDNSDIYSVTMNNKSYKFHTPDFMHGFSTGALWSGVDHHKYWNNLIEHVDLFDENGNLVQKLLNF